jgi:uncharacterized protein (TIGR00297 family)
MPEPALTATTARPRFSTRKLIHVSMLAFAFLLPYFTWVQAAGLALLALLFNLFVLPRCGLDLGKRAGAGWTGIILYPISVLLLILFYRHHLHIAGAAWALMALGDGLASVVGETMRGPRLPWNREKTWWGFAGFVVAGAAGAFGLSRWIAPQLPTGKVLAVCLAAAVVGAIVESLPIRLDDNASVPLVSGAFMFCAYLASQDALAGSWPLIHSRLWLALGVNAALAIAALSLRMVTRSGASVGFLFGSAIYLAHGYRSFNILLGFFLLGTMATRLGYAAKAGRGIAERRGGARSWREALANSLAGTFFVVLAVTTHNEAAFLAAFVAAFAEAAGDTVSSEIGQWLSKKAYLITTLRPVPAGENGGVSAPGTAAGVVASALIVGLGYSLGLVDTVGAGIALAAAVAGNLFDSVLGASLERRGLVTNGIVNFAGTSLAGALALAFSL